MGKDNHNSSMHELLHIHSTNITKRVLHNLMQLNKKKCINESTAHINAQNTKIEENLNPVFAGG